MILAKEPRHSPFLDRISDHPVLTHEEETVLIRLAQAGNKRAQKKLATHNLKFVIKYVSRFRWTGIPMEDLVHEGIFGLFTAAMRFKPETNLRFMSYAVWWIRQAVTKAIQDTSRPIRISADHETPLRRLRQTPLHQSIGGEYIEDVHAVAGRHRLNPAHLLASLRATARGLRLDSPLTDGGPALSETLPSDAPQADAEVLSKERKAILARLTRILTPLQRQIITCLFGLGDRPPLTLRDIGIQTNLSHERVRQIKCEAMALMQRAAGKMRD